RVFFVYPDLLAGGSHASEHESDPVADARRELGGEIEPGRSESLPRSGDGEMHETVGAADLLALHVVERIEVSHLVRDPRLETGRIKAGDRADAAPPRGDAVPGLLDRRAEWGDHAETRHHDTAALAVLHRSSLARRSFLEGLDSCDLGRLQERSAGVKREGDHDERELHPCQP